jgi:hypothetical protein
MNFYEYFLFYFILFYLLIINYITYQLLINKLLTTSGIRVAT